MKIHVFGDSHASNVHSHWGRIKIPNVIFKCHHIGGKLMYTFGRLGLNLLNIKNSGVKENDIVIFCFGEIDCRNHVHKHINKNKSYKDIIDELAINYFEAIKKNVSEYTTIKTCIYNIVPPVKYRDGITNPGHPFPYLGTDNERKKYYTYMNLKLSELCKENNMIFFDIYNESCNADGFLRDDYSDGNCHLRNTTDSTKFIKENLL